MNGPRGRAGTSDAAQLFLYWPIYALFEARRLAVSRHVRHCVRTCQSHDAETKGTGLALRPDRCQERSQNGPYILIKRAKSHAKTGLWQYIWSVSVSVSTPKKIKPKNGGTSQKKAPCARGAVSSAESNSGKGFEQESGRTPTAETAKA